MTGISYEKMSATCYNVRRHGVLVGAIVRQKNRDRIGAPLVWASTFLYGEVVLALTLREAKKRVSEIIRRQEAVEEQARKEQLAAVWRDALA